MEGLQFINFGDKLNQWPIEKVKEVVDKVSEYAKAHNLKNVMLRCVEDQTWEDPVNQRYNIEISYYEEKTLDSRSYNTMIVQNLLLMKGEIVTAKEFHKRFEEFYPKKTLGGEP